MKIFRWDILRILLIPILEFLWFVAIFWLSYNLRNITDFIPFFQLRIPYISPDKFEPFALTGAVLWILTYIYAGLYSYIRRPLFDEIFKIIKYSFFWFLIYIGFVYLTTGFLFSKEIPRLIIFYSLFFGIFFSIIIRSIFHFIWKFLHSKNYLYKRRILVLNNENESEKNFLLNQNDNSVEYFFDENQNLATIESLMRKWKIDAILIISGDYSNNFFQPIISLAKIYGISCVYPQISPNMKHFKKIDTFLAWMPVFELTTVSISAWEQIAKRIFDIIFSLIFIILASPILVIAYIGIKIEDPTWPVIYRNRRIGQNGKIFTLFKFRYMYWKYCTKEDYLKNGEKDEWLEFEEKLKKSADNSRTGPLYKIQNDPRKMKFGWFLEKFSIDELPQLFNVLIGNMSLVGPRPHQGREVALYDESDKQVLTIKPGITGMAQVYGRDKNTFKEEVALDVYYIENYSFLLDIMIILRTILVVLKRPFEKK